LVRDTITMLTEHGEMPDPTTSVRGGDA